MLWDVATVLCNSFGIAVLKYDGRVLMAIGEDPSSLEGLNATSLHSDANGGFAVVTTDGDVVVWGLPHAGGDAASFARDLKGHPVDKLYSLDTGFAALMGNRSLVSWGIPEHHCPKGFRPHPQDLADVDIVRIVEAQGSFAALREDGSLVAWGCSSPPMASHPHLATNSSRLLNATTIYNVTSLAKNKLGFAALTASGRVYTWGTGAQPSSTTASFLLANVSAVHGEDVLLPPTCDPLLAGQRP